MANANLYAQYAQPVRTVQDYQNEAARAQLMRGQSAIQQLTLRQAEEATAQRAAADQRNNALMQLFRESNGAPDPQVLRAQGFIEEADAREKFGVGLEKDRAAIGETQAKTKKTAGEAVDNALKRYRGMLDYIDTPHGAARWLQAQYQDPDTGPVVQALMPMDEAVQRIPTDPQGFQKWRLEAGVGMEKVAQWAKEREIAAANNAVQVRGQDLSAETQRRGQDIGASTTIRGQNMTDARAREATVGSLTKPFEVTGPDGVPILVRQDKAGNITRVEGFGPKTGASKPLTEGQAKGLLFGSRARESAKIMDQLEADGVYRPGAIKQSAESVTGLIPFIGDKVSDIAGTATNWTQSPKQQRLEQAQRDFINAVLRRESGAVISPEEFRNAAKQYFPVVGEDKESIRQKAALRKMVVQGLLAEVPEAQRASIASPPKPNTQKADGVVDWGDLK